MKINNLAFEVVYSLHLCTVRYNGFDFTLYNSSGSSVLCNYNIVMYIVFFSFVDVITNAGGIRWKFFTQTDELHRKPFQFEIVL